MLTLAENLWPCLSANALDVFATTADQRYLLGEEVFLETHFPINLRRFAPQRPSESVSEEQLLATLSNTTGLQPGNRVFVLYGAAGSGKSELMRWLHVQFQRQCPERAEIAVRIPRTELNVLRIIERFHHMLSGQYFAAVTHQRWEQAREKPRTLAKLLLLTALERSLNSDEQINALYYRLLAWIEPRIATALQDITGQTEADAPLNLLTYEDLEAFKAESALSFTLDYEQFRYHLTRAFQEQLLENIHLPAVLQQISHDLQLQRKRPLLLIDDLVQSMNLFATDLLDTFITLDSGNWDVVIGLTPSALVTDARGKALLERITYLDTVDDRVEKLWLSDVRGNASYFLTEESCPAFAARYLDMHRARNGWRCSACPHRPRCEYLGAAGADLLLAPFNALALQRLFRALPEGKGQARQFIRVLREVLHAFSEGEAPLQTLSAYSRLDTAVEAEDPLLAHLAELYAPPANGTPHVILKPALLAAFGLPKQTLQLPAAPLRKSASILPQDSPAQLADDPVRSAIKDWLEGRAVNRQSLVPLRRGIARWLRTACPVEGLHAPGIARPHNVLTWRELYLDVSPPILLEGVDEGLGLHVPREIGLTAFYLYDYVTATGREAQALITALAQDPRLLPLRFAAEALQRDTIAQLEAQLGCGLDMLALALTTVLLLTEDAPRVSPPGLDAAYQAQVAALRAQRCHRLPKLDAAQRQNIWYLFEDWFKLRENLLNGPRLQRLLTQVPPSALLDWLLQVDASGINTAYRLGKQPLRETLQAFQRNLGRLDTTITRPELSEAAQGTLHTLKTGSRLPLHQVPADVWRELQASCPEDYTRLWVSYHITERPGPGS